MAKLVWLREHKDDTKEQFREAEESGRREREIQAIKNRPVFQRFLKENHNNDFSTIMNGIDPSDPNGFAPLDEAYGLSQKRQERFDAIYDPIWNGVKNDPVKGQKLLDAMGKITSDPKQTDSNTTTPIKKRSSNP